MEQNNIDLYLKALQGDDYESKPKPKKSTNLKLIYEGIFTSLAGTQQVTDNQSGAAEATYAGGQDDSVPSSPVVDAASSRKAVVNDVINDLEELKAFDWSQPLSDDVIEAMAQTLKEIDIEPTDMYAALGASPDKQEQYLITGPGSYEGSKGALQDLIDIITKEEDLGEDESNPSEALPYSDAGI